MKKIKIMAYIVGDYVGHLILGLAMLAPLVFFGGVSTYALKYVAAIVNDAEFMAVISTVDRLMIYIDIVFILWWSAYSTYTAIKNIIKEINGNVE